MAAIVQLKDAHRAVRAMVSAALVVKDYGNAVATTAGMVLTALWHLNKTVAIIKITTKVRVE